jgi:hypothetical protein
MLDVRGIACSGFCSFLLTPVNMVFFLSLISSFSEYILFFLLYVVFSIDVILVLVLKYQHCIFPIVAC